MEAQICDVRSCKSTSRAQPPALDCPLLKGNQAATPKKERPNGKNTQSKFFFEIGQELVRTAHLKAQ